MLTLSETDFNKLLKVLENPVRRKIIERLSKEPNYALQLSKDLGLGQQLVAKHLKVMEDSELVRSKIISNPLGPQKKVYLLSRSFSIILDVAPYLFKQNIVFFDVEPEKRQVSGTIASFMERRDKILEYPAKKDKMEPFSQILADIDGKLEAIEEERVLLLSVRNSIMREASEAIKQIDDADARRVFHQAFDEHDRSVEKISEALNLREEKVKHIMQKLKMEFKTEYFQ